MPIILDCQSCARKLRIPDELMGQPVKCPTCGHVFEFTGSEDGQSPLPPPDIPATDIPHRPPTAVPRAPAIEPLSERSKPASGFGYVQVSQDSADPPAPGRRPPAPLADDRPSRRPAPLTTIECPFCGAYIPQGAKRCDRCLAW